MKTLILERDQLTAELLETVAAGLRIGARAILSSTIADARQRLTQQDFDLILTGWDLPDGSGLDLARSVRRDNPGVPIVMICERADRQSVMTAAASGVSVYISKPFNIRFVHERLKALIHTDSDGHEHLGIEQLLARSITSVGQLPTDIDPVSVLELMEDQDSLSPARLAEIWREEVSLIARLLDVANSTSFRRSGEPVKHLKDAIASLGVPMALNQAMAMAIDVSNQMHDQTLKTLARQYLEKAIEVAKAAQLLSIRLNRNSPLYQTAGLLSRVGEMAVLKILSQHVEQGGSLAEGEAEALVQRWAQEYGNKVKIAWKLPLELRDLIGTVHFLRTGNVKVELTMMRTAALISEDLQNTPECRSLLRRIGLSEEDLHL